ncbi:MAG: hypothetical protein EXR36_13215 [Betaproteobacteria bacterium]|nr:hypothetical protein [Betaproteobacteria bacterium]
MNCSRKRARLCIFEPQLSTRFNSARRYEVLRTFLLASRTRQIRILVHDPSAITRSCPRLVQLLRQYSYAVLIHETPPEAKRIHDPFSVADHMTYVRRFHHEDSRGVTSLGDETTALELVRRFDEMWELSSPAVTATVLGL